MATNVYLVIDFVTDDVGAEPGVAVFCIKDEAESYKEKLISTNNDPTYLCWIMERQLQ